MKIYREDIELVDIELDDKSIHKNSIMGDDVCELNFIIDQYINFQIADYILYNDVKYRINTPYKRSKVANNEYEYNIRFEGLKFELGKILVKLDGNTNFFLNSDIEQILDLIITNINTDPVIVWSKGITSITPYYNFQISSENCLQLLTRACLQFNVEFEVIASETGVSINVRDSIGIYDGIDLRYKAGIFQINSEAISEDNVITKLYAYGANRNIPSGYGSDRIKIDPLIKNDDKYGIIEKVIEYPDIYPHFNGQIDYAGSPIHFADSSINFNLNSYLIPGVTAKVAMLSGNLAGYEFEIEEFDNINKIIKLIVLTDDIGQNLPSTGALGLNSDDRYTFVDIYMPSAYLDEAEAELLTRAQDYINKYSEPLVKFSITIDARYLRKNLITLNAGQKIVVFDSDMGIDLTLRIYTISQSLADPYNYSIELTDNLMTSRMVKLIYGQFDIIQRLEQLKKELRILKNN